MPVTIIDIAKKLNISHSTVSRALNNSPLIHPDTSARIRAAADEMGYLHSAAARSLKTRRSQALGVIVSNINDPFFGEILQGVEEVAQNNNYSLFIAATQYDLQREQHIVQTMREHRVDGVIICSAAFSPSQSNQFARYGIPIVAVNHQAAEDYRYSIYHDDIDGSRQLTRYLISLGHRAIAYLGNSTSGRTTADRQYGYAQEMAAANLPVPSGYHYEVPGGDPASGLAAVSHFLSLPKRPTAVLCYNDMVASGLLHGFQQAGLRVPQDISITGFDNIVFSAFTNPPLTTFDQPKRFIGAEAARLVFQLLNAPQTGQGLTEPVVQTLKGSLVIRQSTAAPAIP